MDDDLNRAARKHKISQRQGALRAQRRQQQQADQLAEVASQASRLAQAGAGHQTALTTSPPPLEAAASSATELPADEVSCPGGPFVCFICTEEKQPEERFLPHRCSVEPRQLCCKGCFIAWVESQIDNDAAVIRCCHCEVVLDAGRVARLVSPQHWARCCETALQRSLRRAAFVWCPKCPGGGWVELGQTSSCGWTCPECTASFLFCPLCRRDHGSITCKRFQRLRYEVMVAHGHKEKLSESLVQRSSKTCPSCQMPIQKEGGCNFMDCPNCRRHFCWSCGLVLKGSHQKHRCDAGFEGSRVISKTPNGQASTELTLLFTNILDIDHIELLNAQPEDLEDFREMLVPGLSQEVRSPLFVGPSECDGEILARLPFNFQKFLSWEITHITIRASHPPQPGCRAPRFLGILANQPNATFSDFDHPKTVVVPLVDSGRGTLLANLEEFKVRGTFRRIFCLVLRFSISSILGAEGDEGDEGDEGMADGDRESGDQVFFNDLAIFGVPGDRAADPRRGQFQNEDLIVSPVIHRKHWGEEAELDDAEKQGEGDW
mmetsp:Transcript_69230/g.150662  ORF Transcript_69230/g.150662 Transcript_69230/m.150662 type:complete len:547 (+) Transcript_69230:46-1686(+)